MTEAAPPAARSARASDLFGRFALLLFSSYGLLYFSYKFLIPWSGTNDFQHYYWMYRQPLNFHVAPSPFVLRQLSAVLTWVVWKAHIFYPNDIWFVDPRYDQHVFFAALFTNWIGLVGAALVAGIIAEEMLGVRSFFAGILAGYVCLLSFHTQFVVISGITEGVSWLLLALGFLAYLRRIEWAVALVLALAILQREALIVAIAAIAILDLLRSRADRAPRTPRAFQLRLCAYAAVCFAAYLVLRKLIPGNGHQASAAGVLASLARVRPSKEMLFQSFLNQNVVLIALGAAIVAGRKAGLGAWTSLRRHRWLPILLGTFASLALLALCAGLDVDIGRIAGNTIPLFAASAAADLVRIGLAEGAAIPPQHPS